MVQRVDQADLDLEVGRACTVATHRQARRTNPAVEHPDELGYRDREPDIGVLDFRHRDPDQSPFLVDDRPAAIARIDRSIDLDVREAVELIVFHARNRATVDGDRWVAMHRRIERHIDVAERETVNQQGH